MEYFSLNFNQELSKVNIHNEYSILFTIAVKNESGKWTVDCSEVKKLDIHLISYALENELSELLNSEEDISNEILNSLFQKLRMKYSV